MASRHVSRLLCMLPSLQHQAHIGEIIITTSTSSRSLFQTRTPSSFPSLQSINPQHTYAIHRYTKNSINSLSARHLSLSPPRPAKNVTDDFDLTPPDTGIIRIDGYDDSGFIVGDVQVEGSILCYGDLWLSWKPQCMKDITIETLPLIDLLKPIPNLVVIGSGKSIQKAPDTLRDALLSRNVAIEILDTANAVSTFNILNQEGRKVIGAMLPAGSCTDDDV